MIEKECEYCGTSYEANRKDAKYCSKTCKNDAYLARKANPYLATGQSQQTSIGAISSHNRRNGSATSMLTKSSLDKILSGASANQSILNHLLSEKDFSGDVRSEKSKLEIQLMFIQRDLELSQKKEAEQSAYIEKLEAKVEKNDSFIDRLMSFLEENPAVLMGLTSAIGNIKDKISTQTKTSE